MTQESASNQDISKKEWRTFLFIIIAMFPALAVAFVGSYGFLIWFSQMLLGPPGHG